MAQIKKLIEVALPLDAINAESTREKSIRHGHPSTLHLWWARRPLAAARAVLWASLVDDPSSHPELFPTEDAQVMERQRLHTLLAKLVKWENSNDENILNEARAEIRKYMGEEPLIFLDPFAGGGSIPLEAQRLGLEAHAHDLNPVAVELAEVSLWLNTIYEGGFVPWFGTQLMNGNSLIGARRQVYRIENAQSTSKGLRWYEMEPDRVPLGTKRMPKKQVYHFLLGDPGMCSYSDKVIKQLEPANIKEMKDWNKKFTSPVTDDEVVTLLRLSEAIDKLWEAQIELRKEVGAKT